MRPNRSQRRPSTAGPPTGPASPFPIPLSGPIVKGFGRGSKDLGIPTANIPLAGLSVGGHENVESGVYFGWTGVDVDEDGRRRTAEGGRDGKGSTDVNGATNGGRQGKKGKGGVWPMVMSIGWNPFYKNSVRSVEVHILHTFPRDFYGARMNLLILGFIRPEYDYVSKESLIEDINIDIEVARRSLEREAYASFRDDGYLVEFEGRGHDNEVAS